MKKTIFKLNEIAVKDFNRKEKRLLLNIRFNKEETMDEFDLLWNMSNIPGLVNEILLKIKSRDKIIIEADSDDILDNIYITRIADEEFVEDRMLDFFKRLTEKPRFFPSVRYL